MIKAYWLAYERLVYWTQHLVGWHGSMWCRGLECGTRHLIRRGFR